MLLIALSHSVTADDKTALKQLGAEITTEHGGTKVHLHGAHVTDEGLSGVKFDEFNPALKSLSLVGTNVTDEKLADLVVSHETNEPLDLTSLDLSRSARLSDGSLDIIKKMTGLETLNLSGTKITDQGLGQLKDLKQLQSLKLSSNPMITEASIPQLCALPNLRSLDLSGNAQLADGSLDALKEIPSLETLNLSGTKITDQGLGKLKDLKQFYALNLSSNPMITDASIPQLQSFTGTGSLDLNGTGITIDGLLQLPHLKNSTSWNFYAWDIITDQGMLRLRAAKYFDKCRFMNVAFTDITDGALPAVNGLNKLETLVMTRTGVSDDGMKQLTQLPALTSLAVDFTKVTEAGKKVLRKNLPRCKIR
jgi:Leucine-rich repeat (LRR) protein